MHLILNLNKMNIAIIGYGKMGQEIEKIAIERGHTISLIIDKKNNNELNSENLKKIDVAIEFSRPETAYSNYIKCFEANVPVVSGTTGWLDKFDKIKSLCENDKKGFFYASNFSLGVNIFFELNKKLAKIMNGFKDYDIDMEEVHHIHKLDSPSGTAITLAEGIIENNDSKENWTENTEYKKNDIYIKSYREGEVPGIHRIKYESEVDLIKIEHSAKTRKGFCFGAVLAAEYMNGKTGMHSMKDMLGNI